MNDSYLLTDTRNGSFHSPKALSIRKQVDSVVQALEIKISFLSKERSQLGIELNKVKRDREKLRNAYAEVRRKERAQRKAEQDELDSEMPRMAGLLARLRQCA